MKYYFDNKKAYVGYITAGQQSVAQSLQHALALHKGGVDILELGVPFSDPIADGPTIQTAMHSALQHKITLSDVLQLVRDIKSQCDMPIVIFSYANPLYAYGLEQFFIDAKAAGVDALLLVDLPLESAEDYLTYCKQYDIAPVLLISPSTPIEKIKTMQDAAFLYYVCRNGTTGMRDNMPDDYIYKIKMIKENTNLPVVAGFGIASRAQAHAAIAHADGFVVGSAFIQAITDQVTTNSLTELAVAIDPR